MEALRNAPKYDRSNPIADLPVHSAICWVASTTERDAVFPLACKLTEPGQCQLVLCLDSLHRLGCGDKGVTQKGPLTPEVISLAEEMLKGLYGQDANAIVLPGHPITEVRRYARNHDFDLIVMGEQALSIEREYAERLIDDTPCAVLILSTPKKKPPIETATSYPTEANSRRNIP